MASMAMRSRSWTSRTCFRTVTGQAWRTVIGTPSTRPCSPSRKSLPHTTRWNELGVYLVVNYFIFAGAVVAMWFFVTALDRLRTRMTPGGH